MGYLVENFLLATSQDVEKPEKTWDKKRLTKMEKGIISK